MKLNLINSSDQIINGYVNIASNPVDVANLSEGIKLAVGQHGNFDPMVKDGEAEEILLSPPLNILLPNDLPEFITYWHKKLGTKGKLKVHLIDIRRVGLRAHSGEYLLPRLHELVFGVKNNYRSVLDTAITRSLIENLGFNTQMIFLDEVIAVLEAEKNA